MRHQIGQILDQLAPQAAARFRQARDESRLKSDYTTTPLGFRFRGNQSMQDGSFEPVETAILQHLLQDAGCFVNIGANIGYYCCLALSRGVHTIAFEPLDVNVQLLQSNLAANGFDRHFELFPIGLSQHPGVMKMYGDGTGASMVPGWAGTSAHYFRHVPVNTLDNVLHSRLGSRAIILMDIEGGEYPALLGGAKVLASASKPTWVVEICISEHQPAGTRINPHLKETFQLFWDAGYEAFTAEQRPQSVSVAMVDQVVQSGVDSFKTHNFVFLESGRSPDWTKP